MKKLMILCLVLAGSAASAFSASAQGPEKSAQGEAQAPIIPAPYVLGPEDGISVNVINFANLSMSNVIIPPDGTITVPLLKDPVSVLGKTTTEVAALLAQKWRRYVINPSVSVTLTTRRKDNILIYGFAAHGGAVEYRPDKKLMQALAEVGGAAPQGDLARVTITHKSGERQVLNLSHPETLGGTDKDIPLAVGDVIYIPERRTQFTVVGEVSRPGSFDYRDDMTVMDALTTVGGVRETADLAGSTLIRDEKSERLDLDALLRRGDGSVNKKLEAGDRIVVPEIRNRVYFFGAVARPGYYNFKPADTIIDALTGVGGPTSNASLRDVKHLRIDKVKNKSVVSTINVEQFLKKGDLKGNIALQPGDILFVGDKKRPLQAQDMFGLFSGLGSIETVMRLFTGGR